MQKEMNQHPSRIREGIRNRLLNILYGDFIRFRRDPDMGEMILHMTFLPPNDQLHFLSAEMEKRHAAITRILQDGIESGELKGDPHTLAAMLMGISTMVILEHVFIEKHSLTRRNAGRFVDIFLRGAQA